MEMKNSKECIGSIDALRVGDWTRFVNHSCRSNTTFESRRVGGEMRIFVVVTREIDVGEELTVNYGKGYWEGIGVKCCCGEKRCVGGMVKK